MRNHRRSSHLCCLPGAARRLLYPAVLTALLCFFSSSCDQQRDSGASASGPSARPVSPHPTAPSGENPAPPPQCLPAREKAVRAYEAGLYILKDSAELKNVKEAEKEFTLAIRHDENFGPAYLYRGICRRNLNKSEEALKDFLKAAELMPKGDKGNALFQAALLLMETGRLAEAEARFKTLASFFPDNPKSYYCLGVIAEKQCDLPLALKHFNTVLKKKPAHTESLMQRACLYAVFHEFDESFDDLARLNKLNNRDPRYKYLEGHVYRMRGRWRLDRAQGADLEKDESDRLADGAFADFEEAVRIFTELIQGESVALEWGIAHTEAVASLSNAHAQFYSEAALKFEEILNQVRTRVSGTKAQPLRIFLPRLHRDLAVVRQASGGDDARRDAVEHLEKAVSFTDDLPGLWACDGISLIDKWLAYRAVCDAMHGLVKILVSSRRDYAEAQEYLERLLTFQTMVKADYGPAAAERKRERKHIREAIYECEFQKMAAPESAEYTYEECVAFLAHPYYKIRLAGLLCLGRGDDAKCKTHVLDALDDPDERVVGLAVSLTEEKRIKAAVPKLVALITGDKAQVAVAAVSCLGKLLMQSTTAGGDIIVSDEMRSGMPALIKALESDSAFLREAAIDALSDVTGRTLMYHHDDPAETRARAAGRWKEWWGKIIDNCHSES